MDTQRIRKQMLERFYVEKQQAGGKVYFDFDTKQTGLSSGVLVWACANDYGIDDREADTIVKMTNFRPLAPAVVYEPEQPKIVVTSGIANRNYWQPAERRPNPQGDPEPFLRHLLDVLGSQDKVDFLVDMLAWRYQNLKTEKKPHCAFYFYHTEGGHGKSVFLDTISKVFGSTTVKSISTVTGVGSMSQVELWTRSWFLIDEAKIAKGSAAYDLLKANTGRDTVESDNKNAHFAEYQIPALLMIMSNRPPQFIEDRDRRFFVSEWKLRGLTDSQRADYFTEYCEWLEVGGGFEAIGGLLATRKVTRNIYADVPLTPEKAVAMGATVSPLVEAIEDWLAENEQYRLFHFDHFEELRKRYDTKASALAHRLQEAGLHKAGRIKVNNSQKSVWLRKCDKIELQTGGSLEVVTPFGTQSVNEAYYESSGGEF